MPSFSLRPNVLIVCLVLSLTSTSRLANADDLAAPHVRMMTPEASQLMIWGRRQSPTLDALIEEIEAAPMIVHVVADISGRRGAGSMRFVGFAGGYRLVRVRVDRRLRPAEFLALLGHELQHVVEVSRTPAVVDQRSLGRLYAQIGIPASSPEGSLAYETRQAERVSRQVWLEIRRRPHEPLVTADAGAPRQWRVSAESVADHLGARPNRRPRQRSGR